MGLLRNIGLKSVSVLARGLGLTDPRLYSYLSGGSTYAGESVSVATAMQLDAVWACVRLLSQTVATLPLNLFKRDSEGRGIIDREHPLYRVLHDQPNADMTATEFWEAMVACVLLWGNAFAEIVRSGARIVALIPMRPDHVTVRRQQDGSLLYVYTWLGKIFELQEADVFHIKGFSLDGLVGLSPVTQARHSLGTAIAAEKAAGSLFRNGMRSSSAMMAPAYLNKTQRADADGLIAKITGSINAGSMPLLEGGWKIEQLSMSPQDAELLLTRAFQTEVICRWFDVPPAMIGHTEKTTAWGTGLEQMMLWFLTFSLRPHLKRIEQAIAKGLLTPAERDTHYAEFNADALMRADSAGRAALYSSAAQNGWKTRNEIRALENDPPLPGGDDLTVQVNLVPIELLGQFVRGRPDAPLDPGYVAPDAAPGSELSPTAPTDTTVVPLRPKK
jgi:HK97 family phage portal protein